MITGRPRADDVVSVDVRDLARPRWLAAGTASVVTWTQGGVGHALLLRGLGYAVETERYRAGRFVGRLPVSLTSTHCYLGGSRPWFLCPGCGRRVAVLYVLRDIRCRTCHGLRYDSDRSRGLTTPISRLRRRRRRLGGSDNLTEPFPPRPRRMRRRTYERLVRQAAELDLAAAQAMRQMMRRALRMAA